jgi:YndJ-like protein
MGADPAARAYVRRIRMARFAIHSAVVGALLWLLAPFAPLGAPPAFGSIEHAFVFLPLVAAPLALQLLSRLLEPDAAPLLRIARLAQPMAAALVLASFFVAKGRLAGALTAGWLLVTLLLAVGGLRRARSSPSLLAAHLFLPIGAVWLLLSRLGAGPRHFSALTVFLAALHFHYSGFTLQILIAATGRSLPAHRPWLAPLHRSLSIGAIAGIPLIAAGNLLTLPPLKLLGVSAMVLSTLALAVTSTAVALDHPARTPRLLLLTSAASIATAMLLAATYAVGELTGSAWIGIPRMVAIHGLTNALGFTLCGLVGHLASRTELE